MAQGSRRSLPRSSGGACEWRTSLVARDAGSALRKVLLEARLAPLAQRGDALLGVGTGKAEQLES